MTKTKTYKTNLFPLLELHHLWNWLSEQSRESAIYLNVKQLVEEKRNQYVVEMVKTYRVTIEENERKVEVFQNGQWVSKKGLPPVTVRIVAEAIKNRLNGIQTNSYFPL